MMKNRRMFMLTLSLFLSLEIVGQNKADWRVLDPVLLVVDSITLAQQEGSTFRAISARDVKLGATVLLWIRLKGTSREAISMIVDSGYTPVNTKWFRNLNYGFVPERTQEKQNMTVRKNQDIKAMENQLMKQKFFYYDFTSVITVKRPGQYLARLVFNNNTPVLQNEVPCEFKFDVSYGKSK